MDRFRWLMRAPLAELLFRLKYLTKVEKLLLAVAVLSFAGAIKHSLSTIAE